MPKSTGRTFSQSLRLVRTVCDVAGSASLISNTREHLELTGIVRAIRDRDSDALFSWLLEALCFAGVSDAAAATFIEANGIPSAEEVRQGLATLKGCGKTAGFWTFTNCGYRKGSRTCSQPGSIDQCSVPGLTLRNGSLNQTAKSAYLFFRDVTQDDFVGWIDRQIDGESSGIEAGDKLIRSLLFVHGASWKTLSMSLSALLLAGDPERKRWVAAGAQLIAIDTLVHAWLHRTGILRGQLAEHPYGPACYAPGNCESIVRRLARRIDARRYNASFPGHFPRFVQHAIWRFCAQQQLNQCNGNNINDIRRCGLSDCILYDRCCRLKLGRSPNVSASTQFER